MEYYYQNLAAPQVIHNRKICFEPHFHNETEIIFFFGGSATLTVNGTDYEAGEGECLVVFPNIIHSYRSERNVDVGKFIFDIDSSEGLRSCFRNNRPVSPVISVADVKRSGLDSLAREILDRYGESSPHVKEAYLTLLAAKALELCELVPSDGRTAESSVSAVIQFCRTNYRDPEMSLGMVSGGLHISRSHISHIFCNGLKINFRRYINIMRVNDATRLLADTDASVTEISETLGFGSLRMFDKAFREITGASPREYRKAHRGEGGLQ